MLAARNMPSQCRLLHGLIASLAAILRMIREKEADFGRWDGDVVGSEGKDRRADGEVDGGGVKVEVVAVLGGEDGKHGGMVRVFRSVAGVEVGW